MVDLSKLAEYGDFYKIALGDTVHVFEDNIEHKQRIVSMTYYPYSAKQPSVTIGQPTLANPYYHAWYMGKLIKTIQKNSGRANKLKTSYFHGTLNSTQNPVESDNKKLLLDGDLLYIEDNKGRRRINLGNMDGAFVFQIFNQLSEKTIEMDDDGNVTITGVFATGTDKNARTVIDKNGIQSYDADGQRDGLWCNEPNSVNQSFSDLTLYNKGKEIFQIYNEGFYEHLKSKGKSFLGTNGDNSYAYGKWKFEQGASGTFQTADGKTVTVSGGLITDIS